MPLTILAPQGLPRPRGFSHGVIATGRALHVAGQIGCEPDGSFTTDDLVLQFGRALDAVLAVVAAGGGRPTDVARMTVYVTDLATYRRSGPALGEIWRARFGRHYPAMALVGVTALVEPLAKVEIEAVAYLEPTP